MNFFKTAFLAGVVGLMAVSAAHAHAKMVNTMPADAAEVKSGLSAIAMNFNKPMRLTVVKIVRNANNKPQAMTATLPRTFSKSLDVAVEPLDAGNYDVNWSAISSDGHVMNGKFSFSVTETGQ